MPQVNVMLTSSRKPVKKLTILSWHYHFLKANIQTGEHFLKHLGKSMNKKKKTSLNLCCLSVVFSKKTVSALRHAASTGSHCTSHYPKISHRNQFLTSSYLG